MYDAIGKPGLLRMISAFFAFCALQLCRASNMSGRHAKRQVWHLRRRLRCAADSRWFFRPVPFSRDRSGQYLRRHFPGQPAFETWCFLASQGITSSAGMRGIRTRPHIRGALSQSIECTKYSFSPRADLVPPSSCVKNSTNSRGGGRGGGVVGRSYGVAFFRGFEGAFFAFFTSGRKDVPSESDKELDSEAEEEDL